MKIFGCPHVQPVALSDGAVHDLLQKHCTRLLGEGASCTVFLVTYKGASRCLKLSKLKGNKDFVYEASTLLTLDGAGGAPRLLGVTDGTGQELALLTTYCGEHTFVDLPSLARSDATMLRAFLDLCRALQQVHARGVVHNDIKANNVVVRRDPDSGRLRVSLIDYGIARAPGLSLFHEELDHSKAPWMAPELVACSPCSPAGDVYSLGRLLDQILSRCTAPHPDLKEVAWHAMARSPEERPSVRAVARAVRRCLAPRRRSFRARLRSVFGGLKKTFGCCLPRRGRGHDDISVSVTVNLRHSNTSAYVTANTSVSVTGNRGHANTSVPLTANTPVSVTLNDGHTNTSVSVTLNDGHTNTSVSVTLNDGHTNTPVSVTLNDGHTNTSVSVTANTPVFVTANTSLSEAANISVYVTANISVYVTANTSLSETADQDARSPSASTRKK